MKDLKLKWPTIKDCPAADYQIVSQISNLLIAAAPPQNSCFFETTVSILSKVFRVFQSVSTCSVCFKVFRVFQRVPCVLKYSVCFNVF